MGLEFVSGHVLVETFNWEVATWDLVRDSLRKDVKKLVEKRDVEGLVRLLKPEFPDVAEEELRKRVRYLIDDVLNAKGGVVVLDGLYADVIDSCLDSGVSD